MDVDNKSPAPWRDLAAIETAIAETLGDVSYYAAPSRNHMIEKM